MNPIPAQPRPEPEARWGRLEHEPVVVKPYKTVRKTVTVWDGSKWRTLTETYSEMPTEELALECQEYLTTGKQITQAMRIKKLKDRVDKQGHRK